ncbi:MAG: beta-ketoacyl-[acyl-carrier-protein] synthase family protein [Thermodesulfovibrionia bacterium]|nr:beta-ketoacyl-[acyl-carrier-protein] synthase family protein [Thermodesulfovibrionia bacterium]
MHENNRMFITGIGAISAAGSNVADTLDSFSLKNRNAGAVTLFDTPLKYPVFEVNKIPDEHYLEGQRTLSLALCAVIEALNDAHMEGDLSKYRLGISMGTTVASQLNDLDFYKSYRSTGSASMTSVDRYLKGNLAEFILRKIGARGPALTVVNACSSGTDAIGVALSWLNNGLCDIAIAGGADELNRIPLCGFGALGIVSMDLCAPFDRDRNGLNLGEGAGILILETKESARKRGITSDLFLAGYGSSSDAYHLTAPHPEGKGLKISLQKALIDAGIKPEEVSFVNAHGTATPDNDLVEGKVLAEIFGTDLKMLSTKGFTGHTLGAAGGLEAVFTASALREGWIPASIGFKNKDEAIPLTPVRERTVINGRYAVSTSLAFGGNNAAIVIGKV